MVTIGMGCPVPENPLLDWATDPDAEVCVAKTKRRQRELARAKWERQQTRRTRVAGRQRKISIAGGVILGLVVTAFLVWLVLHIIDEENKRNPQTPSVPTDSFRTNLLTPSSTAPTGPTQATPSGGGKQTATNGSTNHKPTTRAPDTPKASKTGGNSR
jgi:hypothetical protein